MRPAPSPRRTDPPGLSGPGAVLRRLLLVASILALVPLSVGGAAEKAPAEPPPGWELGGDPQAGEPIFAKRCTVCHGPEGKGDGRIKTDPPPRDLTDPDALKLDSDWKLYLVIEKGGEAVGLSAKMIPWKDMLTEEEVRDVAAYVKSLSAEE